MVLYVSKQSSDAKLLIVCGNYAFRPRRTGHVKEMPRGQKHTARSRRLHKSRVDDFVSSFWPNFHRFTDNDNFFTGLALASKQVTHIFWHFFTLVIRLNRFSTKLNQATALEKSSHWHTILANCTWVFNFWNSFLCNFPVIWFWCYTFWWHGIWSKDM